MEQEKLPKFFIDMLKNQYNQEIIEKIIQSFSCKRKTTFRVNTIKSDINNIKTQLEKFNLEYKTVDWSKEAFIIENADEKEIEKLDIYQNGEIYLQSLSSMLPAILLNPKENTDILDMAAAPGGKTTQMAAITHNKAHITACEINKIRAEKLKYNVEKQGASCVYVMVTDARTIDSFFSFDKILLDSPCSGSGTLSINNKKNIEKFTKKLIEKSIASQKVLLQKAIQILKPGQEMIYSTCSILACENEDIVDKIIRENHVEIVPIENKELEKIPKLPVKIEGTLCVCPDEYYEGFFVCKLKKMK